MPEAFVSRVLFLFGLGFLAANLRLGVRIVRNLRLRRSAVLTWPAPRPPFYRLGLLLGVVLFVLVFLKVIIWRQPPTTAFGEIMMLVYYGYMLPLSLRIAFGFYEHGVWLDDGYMAYSQIGNIQWREQDELTLLVIPRAKRLARRLVVPQELYGAVRRVLRDHIAHHDIEFTGKPFDLGTHDRRDDV